MRLFTGLALFVAASGFTGHALAVQPVAATLTAIKGDVLIDTGKGFAPVHQQTASLNIGDRVMVAKGGSAVLSFGPDCSLPLSSPSMTTVAESACVVGTQGDAGAGGAGGGTGGAGGALLGMGGPLAVGLTGAEQAITNNDNNSPPFSP